MPAATPDRWLHHPERDSIPSRSVAAINISSHGRLAAITVIVIMVTASLDPSLSPVLNALLRFVESCIGTGVAMLEVVLWPAAAASIGFRSQGPRP